MPEDVDEENEVILLLRAFGCVPGPVSALSKGEPMNRKVILITASVILVVGAMCAELLAMQVAKRTEGQNDPSGLPNRAQVSINTKGDAPVELRVANPESAGVDENEPEVTIVITNTSNKCVSAYAIKHEVGLNGQLRRSGVELAWVSNAQSLLRPGDSRTVDIGGARYSLPIERLVVSVDFLEFTDGTTWGPDTYSSREVLAGLRTGAKTAAKQWRQVLAAQGATGFARELERADDDSSIPLCESLKWREGFKQGIILIKERVKREARDFSPTEIERVLSQPIDALDELTRSAR